MKGFFLGLAAGAATAAMIILTVLAGPVAAGQVAGRSISTAAITVPPVAARHHCHPHHKGVFFCPIIPARHHRHVIVYPGFPNIPA